MDKSLDTLLEIQIEQLRKNCELAQYGFDVVEKKEDVVSFINQLILANQSVSVGGSMTLFETGIIDYLQERKDITYYDRYNCEDRRSMFHAAFDSDVYLTSTNAITLKGELINIDGTGNRVAAMIYGPRKVLVVCGVNKIVSSVELGHERLRNIANVANNIRLEKPNPCIKVGHCVDCRLPTRICCAKTIIDHSYVPTRIHIVLVKESLGY